MVYNARELKRGGCARARVIGKRDSSAVEGRRAAGISLPHASIQLSCKGCCEKKGAKPSTTLGRERFRFSPSGQRACEKEKPCLSFSLLSPIPVSHPLSLLLRALYGSSGPSASQPASQAARQPPSQASQSVRGENFIKRFECVGRGFT